ncbi:MAG: hypothetical protein R2879_00520 [Saprospiraceae bacterium]
MIDYHDPTSLLNMIEDAIILNRNQVISKFGISSDELDELVWDGQISQPVKKFGTKWYLAQELEMWEEYREEKE